MLLQIKILSLLLCVPLCLSLECYVCTEQEDNVGKCVTTIKTCKQGEEACLTEIKWGSTPYWSQGAQKQYYYSKRCATKKQCIKTREKYMPYCTHIWYEDWSCSECCQGDRCNYYVINNSNIHAVSFVPVVGALLYQLLMNY
ncbi:uncharacterized protein LOC113383676 [Ctenocephalides felis]|uniref:uncharacterized protein LOC113383676 n=1 Tax=Ctenocephalides felis TaxID=7515 RepID=UPI000E6E51BA|nr:uncharacterized protein LOC113383676 [Ctenocephalides felis]